MITMSKAGVTARIDEVNRKQFEADGWTYVAEVTAPPSKWDAPLPAATAVAVKQTPSGNYTVTPADYGKFLVTDSNVTLPLDTNPANIGQVVEVFCSVTPAGDFLVNVASGGKINLTTNGSASLTSLQVLRCKLIAASSWVVSSWS